MSTETRPSITLGRATVGLLLLLVSAIGVISWLAWQRWESIAYMTDTNLAVTGWAALRASWPIYSLTGVVTAIIGAVLGSAMGENARARDAEARAVWAEHLAADAQKAAERAREVAEADLAEQMRRAELTEQQARDESTAAKAIQRVASRDAERAHQRTAALEQQIAELKMQRDRAISTTHRRKKRIQQLEAQLELRSS